MHNSVKNECSNLALRFQPNFTHVGVECTETPVGPNASIDRHGP
jgi:hypothetical protein